jgi:hypothetical protein
MAKDNIDYEVLCEHYGAHESWELGVAVDLLQKRVPLAIGLDDKPLTEKQNFERKILLEQLKGSIDVSIPRIGVPSSNRECDRAKPSEILNWARRFDVDVPEELQQEVDSKGAYERLSATSSGSNFRKQLGFEINSDSTGVQQAVRDFTPNQIRIHRSQAIAQMLWDENPSLTKEDMVLHPWIIKYGCGERPAAESTMLKWFQGMAGRKPGRPSAKRGQLNLTKGAVS